MNVIKIGGVEVLVDRARTRDTYEALSASGCQCSCAYCRNFRAVGIKQFPDAVLAFFEEAGIDPDLPAETYQYSETAQGKYLYGGEFYFFGKAPLTNGSRINCSASFDFTLTNPSPLAQDEFRMEGAVCFNFAVELPWVIIEAP